MVDRLAKSYADSDNTLIAGIFTGPTQPHGKDQEMKALVYKAYAPDDNFGDKDLQLSETIDQSGPLAEIMT